jgi:hypothetical protein
LAIQRGFRTIDCGESAIQEIFCLTGKDLSGSGEYGDSVWPLDSGRSVLKNQPMRVAELRVKLTPFEPEWEGLVTLEISNTATLPAKVYANEGLCQILFFRSDEAFRSAKPI